MRSTRCSEAELPISLRGHSSASRYFYRLEVIYVTLVQFFVSRGMPIYAAVAQATRERDLARLEKQRQGKHGQPKRKARKKHGI